MQEWRKVASTHRLVESPTTPDFAIIVFLDSIVVVFMAREQFDLLRAFRMIADEFYSHNLS
jgi:hypothetical protein